MDEEKLYEDEIDETPFVEFDISISPSDPTLELLVNQFNRGDIIIPFYQRRYVWKIEQASRLVESFLMGLPVPQIFLYVNDEDQMEVIDGQQRILSMKYFMDGFFDNGDNDQKQVFKLKGLSERSSFNGKTFQDLDLKDQRKLRNSTLRAINIKQIRPSNRNDSVFHIFERLNTGGTQLRPQEIRNAVYRGNIVKELETLNDNKNWRKIIGKKDKNQKDIEIILRLLSLYKNHNQYEGPMVSFLNNFMSKNRDFNSDMNVEFKNKFPNVVKKIAESVEKPFRPNRALNAASLEAIMVALFETERDICDDDFIQRYKLIMENDDFKDCISKSTTNNIVLKKRITIAKEIIEKGYYKNDSNE